MRKISRTKYWKEAKTVSVFISRYPEIDTRPIIRELFAQGTVFSFK